MSSGTLPSLSRRGLFAGALAGLALALRSRPARAAEPQHLLVYWVKGGWDPTFVFDPHFGAAQIEGDPDAEPGEASGVSFADAESRPSVRDFFTTWGAQTAVINGVAVGSISHDSGTRLLLTGRRGYGGEDLPTRIAARCGATLAVPHAIVNGPSFPGTHGGLVSHMDETLLRMARGELPVHRDAARESRLQAYLAQEAEGDDSQLGAWRAALSRVPELEAFAAAVPEAIDSEDSRVFLLAQLFAQGLSCTGILTGDVPPMTLWDSHIQNQLWQDRCYENLFANLGALCQTLSSTTTSDGASLLSRTRVLVLSEMGRQPTKNAQGGKDHWPTTSAMLIGAGVAGGRTYGATDEALVARGLNRTTGEPDDTAAPFDPDSLAATIALGFDLDPEEIAPGATPLSAIWS